MLRHPYGIPTFKTKALRLVTYEGQLKHLLLLYKKLMQPYLSLLLHQKKHFANNPRTHEHVRISALVSFCLLAVTGITFSPVSGCSEGSTTAS